MMISVQQSVEWLARETEVLRENLLCPPQIPHDFTRARTRASAVRSRRLTVWATVHERNFYAPGGER
jgi:hypothetical protein